MTLNSLFDRGKTLKFVCLWFREKLQLCRVVAVATAASSGSVNVESLLHLLLITWSWLWSLLFLLLLLMQSKRPTAFFQRLQSYKHNNSTDLIAMASSLNKCERTLKWYPFNRVTSHIGSEVSNWHLVEEKSRDDKFKMQDITISCVLNVSFDVVLATRSLNNEVFHTTTTLILTTLDIIIKRPQNACCHKYCWCWCCFSNGWCCPLFYTPLHPISCLYHSRNYAKMRCGQKYNALKKNWSVVVLVVAKCTWCKLPKDDK